MAIRICTVDAASDLAAPEIEYIGRSARIHGRVTLLASNLVERDACRRSLARAGLGLGVEVLTPDAWIDSLWDLWGDGCHIAGALQRRLVIADVISRAGEDGLAPLLDNAGTMRLLGSMAGEYLPYALDCGGDAGLAPAEKTVVSLLHAYARALHGRGLVERSHAACLLRELFSEEVPASAQCVMLRNVTDMPRFLIALLCAVATGGDVSVLLTGERRGCASELERVFTEAGAVACIAALGPQGAGPARCVPDAFLEVAGPHARNRSYARHIAGLAARSRCVSVVSPSPLSLFDELSERLAANGVRAHANGRLAFSQTVVGRQFRALADIVDRMRRAEAGEASNAEWWPAPALSDWLYSPVSGAGVFFARAFDKKVRGKRALSVQNVLSELQSVQTRVVAQRRRLEADNPWANVPCVCADVVQYIWQERPISAFKAMLSVVQTSPTQAFGAQTGACVSQREQTACVEVISLLQDTARSLDISQAVALRVVDDISIPVNMKSAVAERVDAPMVRFAGLEEVASQPRNSSDALFFADVDVAHYPLSVDEGAQRALGELLGASGYAVEPAMRMRALFDDALSGAEVVEFARVTHDGQAKDNYPAAIWTELKSLVSGEASIERCGEEEIAADFDLAGGAGLQFRRVECLPPQRLSAAAVPYVVLKRREGEGADVHLVPRQFSASQIESYASCPLCWFMSSRVRPSSLDAEFGNIEFGNFVHDVMFRFHSDLIEEGIGRVRPENLDVSLAVLREAFDAVRAEHARGKTSSSAPLVPLSHTEELQVDGVLPQLERVVRYEAGALSPFSPHLLEYSFNGLGVVYAGMPLGGRIDRVDVDAQNRAVVIDYKHRSSVDEFKLKDPTVATKAGDIPADDPDWIPQHTQALIYAQAIKRALGLDARGALYFATKGTTQAMRGAVSAELAEEERGDGRVPGLKVGFPDEAEGGSMGFEELLDRVEAATAKRFERLASGDVAASPEPQDRCVYNHPIGFERRGA